MPLMKDLLLLDLVIVWVSVIQILVSCIGVQRNTVKVHVKSLGGQQINDQTYLNNFNDVLSYKLLFGKVKLYNYITFNSSVFSYIFI